MPALPGRVLDRLFRQALHAGRKARTETAIGESPASVSSAAAALAEQVFGDLSGRESWSSAPARSASSRHQEPRLAWGDDRVRRESHAERAEELTTRVRRRAAPLDRVEEELARADVVRLLDDAPGWVLTRATVERALPARKGRPLFLIDLAVPRDLDPAIHELEGCYLYDIDDLEAVVAETLAGRRREAERAETIVADEADRFRDWQASLDVVPAITSLRARAEEIRDAELRAREAQRRGAARRGVGDRGGPEQAPASADNSHETGRRGSRWGDLC